MQPTQSFLQLPLEVREQVYNELIFGQQQGLLPQVPQTNHACYFALFFTCAQLFDEGVSFLARSKLQLATRHDTTEILSNVCCINKLVKLRPNHVYIQIDPFQSRKTIPKVYSALLSISQTLRSGPRLSRVKIVFDGDLKRRARHFAVDEFDLERAPLQMIILLQPLMILENATEVDISISGGPLNTPWSECKYLADYINRVKAQLTATQPVDSDTILTISRIARGLQQNSVMWQLDTLRLLTGIGFYPNAIDGTCSDVPEVGGRETCRTCGNFFKSRNQLFTHLRRFHECDSSLSPEGEKKHQKRVSRLSSHGIT